MRASTRSRRNNRTPGLLSFCKLEHVTGRVNMNRRATFSLAVTAAILALAMSGSTIAQQAAMTFFVTSVGSGNGADLGGLAGADQRCQQLAQAAGAGSHTWLAYLSTQ